MGFEADFQKVHIILIFFGMLQVLKVEFLMFLNLEIFSFHCHSTAVKVSIGYADQTSLMPRLI